jgi:hypothetical protein
MFVASWLFVLMLHFFGLIELAADQGKRFAYRLHAHCLRNRRNHFVYSHVHVEQITPPVVEQHAYV